MAKEYKEPVVNFGFRHPDENAQPAAVDSPVPPVEASKAFKRKAEQWKRDLLDVTRRNRGINYRPAKASLILPADPEELWQQLVASDGATSFGARNFAPDAPDPLTDQRAIDAFASAQRLADRAKLADREQGIQVLFLALGWLNWVDVEGHQLRSPMVLAPVELVYDRQEKAIGLQAAADDPAELNPSLAYLLASQLGIRLPQLEDTEGQPRFDSLGALLEDVREAVSRQPGWTVEVDGPVIDVFAFAKLAMVEEIERRLPELSTHPLLRALVGEETLPEAPESDQPLDQRYAPGSLRTVVEADAYQLQALGLAASGVSFVIEGPPGTGKSQTITNIAAELMAQGKRVLFVAEKRVAREVVLENLQTAGLGEACLHLASNAGATSRADAKAQVVKEIVATLDAGPPPPQPDPALPARYGELRQRLNAYANGMGQPLGAGGWTTAFEVFGKAIQLAGDRRENVAIPPIAGRSRYWLDDVLDVAKTLDGFSAEELAPLAGPWVHFQWTANDADQELRLRDTLIALAGLDTSVTETVASVLGPDQLPAGAMSLQSLSVLQTSLAKVGQYRKKAASIFKFINPGFYSARGDFKRYLSDGYRETKTEAQTALTLASTLTQANSALGVAQGAFGGHAPANGTVAEISAWAEAVLPGLENYAVLTELAAALASLTPLEMRDAFATLLADATTHRNLAAVVPATVYANWAAQAAQGDLAMTPEQHGRLADSFSRLDGELTGWARTAVLSEVRSRRPRSVNHSAMAPLVKYARAKRRPALRTMLGNSREAVQLLKPCLLMSPLAAAQYLCHGEGRTYTFDAVIVDEASMIPTPDMVVALSLAPQAIIVGDSKQMPPTNFFNKEISPVSDDENDEEVTFESILDEAAPLLPSTMLRAHYRSRDESLIAFSNAYFYDGRLIAFPDAWSNRPESGVRFEYVADAVYGRGRSRANPAEARRALELLRAELEASSGRRQVAITAMSLAQQSEILEQLADAAALDPLIRGWIEDGGIVRNLETVQGDESDVMLLSVGYGKDADGRFIMNFGPLGQEKGERRLNVAITRAKWKTVVVTSLRPGDIDPTRTTSTGTLRLRDYLDYAERGPVALPAGAASDATTLSAFEEVLLHVLRAHGLDCVPRVGVGGYQVDIAVRHPREPERFVLAIECDGPAYFGAPAARDRELGRKAALERMGWNVHRVFSTAWYRNPETELNRVLDRYRQATL
jgi:Mrp family chromosome partitioning ATPase/very-short-patch-repair endonuclease